MFRFRTCFAVFLCRVALFAGLASLLGGAGPARSAGPAAGALVIVGGGDLPDAVAERFLELAGGRNARLVVIPTATELADTPERLHCEAYWKARGAASVVLLHTRSRERANDPAFARPLTQATAVWLSGGDQSRLTEAYADTLVERELQRLLARGGAIGGTSAGAAALSHVMIVGGNPQARVGTGFDLLRDVVVDTHFHNRQRLDRLLGVLADHPRCTGLGIDESTAAVVTGASVTVLGKGNVRVCQGRLGREPASVQVLGNGGRADLDSLDRLAVARLQAAAAPTATASLAP
jgi:cyanophycinase